MNRPPKNWRPRTRPLSGDPDPATKWDAVNALRVELHAATEGGAADDVITEIRARLDVAEQAD
jgi:hypothetical protein